MGNTVLDTWTEETKRWQFLAEYIHKNKIDRLVVRNGSILYLYRGNTLILECKRSPSKSCVITDETIRCPEWRLAICQTVEELHKYKYNTLFLIDAVNNSLAYSEYIYSRDKYAKILNTVNVVCINDDIISDESDNYSPSCSYEKYNGIYDLSDEIIDDVFEGDPEAYWNID